MTYPILWHSVAPWVGTGYGQQTATFVPRIRELGYDVAISDYYGHMGAVWEWRGVKCYPAYETSYGTDVVVQHAVDHFGAEAGTMLRDAANMGLIITLCDVWTLTAPMLGNMCVASWCPIDHLTLPGPVARWFAAYGAAPIAMSRHGEACLSAAGLDPIYVPHGIDLDVFHPGDRAVAREALGIPADAFVVAIVSANVGKDGSRKAFAEQIAAFAELRRRHSDAVLVLHTDVKNQHGIDITALLDDLPEGSYSFTDQYSYRKGLPPTTVADIYRAANVLSNASWGEGFGIPIVEAQACGTPVIVTNATAMPELVGAGWAVDYEPLWHDSMNAYAAVPRIPQIVQAYLTAYDEAEDLREEAALFARGYDANLVTVRHWVPALERLGRALEQRREDAAKPAAVNVGAPAVVEADGLLWLDRGPGYDDALGPSGHEAELAPVLTSLADGAVVLEVGAHVGHWTCRLARVAAQIYAVEANPDTASLLRRNVAINDLRNVRVIELAAWDTATTLRLDDPNRHHAGGSTRTLPDAVELASDVRVPADRLDSLSELMTLDHIDLVKLDVEGADLHALRGMSLILGRHWPNLFIECHDYAGYYERGELEQTLTDLGYSWRLAHRYATTWHPDGILDEPVDADYLVCVPLDDVPAEYRRMGWEAVSQHGASQEPGEFAQALELVAKLDPDVIVEIGCDQGGTLWGWRHAAPRADVYGITLPQNDIASGGTGGTLDDHGAIVHAGDSHDVASENWLEEALHGRMIDVLVLDGDHSVAGIWEDLRMYGPRVRAGGLILLHDIASKGDDRAHVWEVWPELAARYDTDEILSTVHAWGWGVIHRATGDRYDPPT